LFGVCRSGCSLCVVVLLILIGGQGRLLSAPYPPGGLEVEWVQPDGVKLSLRVFGDEFYARTATPEGYTVIYDEKDKAYHYAVVDGNGDLVSSGARVGKVMPRGVRKAVTERKEKIQEIRAERIRLLAEGERQRWEARVAAVRAARLAAPANGKNAPAADPAAAPISGAKQGLMILVQFPDDPATAASDPVHFPVARQKINRLCNEEGYSDDGNTGSIRDYFHDQSNGMLSFTHAVTPVVTMLHPKNYYNYSDYPANTTLESDIKAGENLLNDAVAALKAVGYDFSAIPANANGNIVSASILFAGNNSGVWSEGLWPHANPRISVVNAGTATEPRLIGGYQITNQPGPVAVIGTLCHELGHLLLGYPDLYDHGYESAGVGGHCLMGSGNHVNGGLTPAPIDLYLKDVLGWAVITDITAEDVFVGTLPSTGNRGYRIRKPGTPTEYFLIENRGEGDPWATYVPDRGVLIWHVDELVEGNEWEQMTDSTHYQLSVEQADGGFDLERVGGNLGDSGDLFDNVSPDFHDRTVPDSLWWSGDWSYFSLKVLSAPGPSMQVSFGHSLPPGLWGVFPTKQLASDDGGYYSFKVASNTTWSWMTSAPWITITESVQQSGNRTIRYALTPNPLSVARTALVTVTSGMQTYQHVIEQAGRKTDDHGDSVFTATEVALGSITGGVIHEQGDRDVFRIEVPVAGVLNVRALGDFDTQGILLNSIGEVVTAADAVEYRVNFRISHPVTPGIYYVSVSSYLDPNPAYRFVCDLQEIPFLMAQSQGVSVSSEDHTGRFLVASNRAWSMSANVTWLNSPFVGNVLEDDGTILFSVGENPSTSPRMGVFTMTSAAGSASYAITQDGREPDDHGDTMTQATPIAVNASASGGMQSGEDADFFRIEINQAGDLMISAGPLSVGVLLYDASGNHLGTGLGFLQRAVGTGTYFVSLRAGDPFNLGSYNLSVTLNPGPVLRANNYPTFIEPSGGNWEFQVDSNITWSWSRNAAWIFSNEPQQRTRSGRFRFSVSSNTSDQERVGTITLTGGGITTFVTITQYGSSSWAYNMVQLLPDGSESIWFSNGNPFLLDARLRKREVGQDDAFDGVGMTEIRRAEAFGNRISGTNWGNWRIENQQTQFSVSFTTIPTSAAMDAVIGLSDGVVDWWDDLAAYVRFSTEGKIDARNGASFGAVSNLPYTAGVSYLVEMSVNVATRRYSVTVTPEGGSPTVIATDYAFRTEQQSVTRLDHVAYNTLGGPQMISDVRVPTMGPVTTGAAWRNFPIEAQTGTFSATFVTRPGGGTMDTTIGFSGEAADFWSDLAAYVRFNTLGRVDARNGANFAAVTNFSYTAGVAYTVRMEVDVAAKRYSATVAPPGGAPVVIAANYVFRTEQATVSSLAFFACQTQSGGTQSVSGLRAPCYQPITASTTWANHAIKPRGDTFVASFLTTPGGNSMDTTIGFAGGAVDWWDDMAAYVRFNTSGTIDARNGPGFTAVSSIPYTAGAIYLVEMEVDVGSKTYRATVTAPGGEPQTIVTGASFRTEQAGVTSLSHFACLAWSGGTQHVRELSIDGAMVRLPVLSTPDTMGPMVAAVSGSSLFVDKRVSLVGGRHATDERISVCNTGSGRGRVTLTIHDNYGSDTRTTIHATSSGDTYVDADDQWFISSDQADPYAAGDDPALKVSWSGTGNVPPPAIIRTPGGFSDRLSLQFDLILGPGEVADITVRRELFRTARHAIQDGLPLSSNADLVYLGSSGGILDPPFSPEITDYVVHVPNTVQWITLFGTKMHPGASLAIGGAPVASDAASPSMYLAVGPTVILTVVTAQDGSEKTYRTTVMRAGVPEIVVEQADGTSLADGGELSLGRLHPGKELVHHFVIRNGGTAVLSGLSAGVGAGGDPGFTIASQPVSSVTGPAQSAAFTIRFSPGGSGLKTAVIRVASNDPDENPFHIHLSGHGATPRQVYDDIAGGYGLTGNNALPVSVPFGDGVKNLLKYAFNLRMDGPAYHPLQAGGMSGLPLVKITGSGAATVISVEYLRRKNSGLSYLAKLSPNLQTGSYQPMTATPVVTPTADPDWERVTLQQTVNAGVSPRLFVTVEVTVP